MCVHCVLLIALFRVGLLFCYVVTCWLLVYLLITDGDILLWTCVLYDHSSYRFAVLAFIWASEQTDWYRFIYLLITDDDILLWTCVLYCSECVYCCSCCICHTRNMRCYFSAFDIKYEILFLSFWHYCFRVFSRLLQLIKLFLPLTFLDLTLVFSVIRHRFGFGPNNCFLCRKSCMCRFHRNRETAVPNLDTESSLNAVPHNI